jgi:hypothetical protein
LLACLFWLLFFIIIIIYIDIGYYYYIRPQMRANLRLRKNRTRFACYGSWKRSKFRDILCRLFDFRVFGMPLWDVFIAMLVLVNGILAAVPETQSHTQDRYANDTLWIFVAEVILKVRNQNTDAKL